MCHWVQVHPYEWPHWNCTCPYDVALQELELNWGRVDRVLSYRKAQQEELRFIQDSREMYDAGFIGYTPTAHVSPEGYLCYPQAVLPYCEWILNSPLTELFSAMAEFEVEAAFNKLSKWLDDIDDGHMPDSHDAHSDYVRLCETEEGLLLIKWTKCVSV